MKRTVDAVATSDGISNEWSIVEGDNGKHTLTLNSGISGGGQTVIVRGTRDELAATLGAALQALGAQRVLVTWQPEFALVHSEPQQPILQWGDKPAEWSITVGDDDKGSPGPRRRMMGGVLFCRECGASGPRAHLPICSETGQVE